MAEMFDVVDAQDRVVAQAARERVHAEGLWHRAVHVLVFNQQAQLYVQKRAASKDTFPGCYDSSASGHVDAGESYDDCAVRELAEELGIAVPLQRLTKLFRLSACELTGWEFVWVYSLHGSYVPLPDPVEIECGRYWDQNELSQAIAASPTRFAPAFCLVLKEFARREIWPSPC